ncbi:hypothetical protein ACS0PU_000231 [Formica fusca]
MFSKVILSRYKLLDYFFWGHIKSLVYEIPVDDPETLVARILTASDMVQNMLGIFEKVRQSFIRRCNACIVMTVFAHLL